MPHSPLNCGTLVTVKRLGLAIVLLVALPVPLAAGHSGGTNAAGCHMNHSTGDYHCHGGGGGGSGGEVPEPLEPAEPVPDPEAEERAREEAAAQRRAERRAAERLRRIARARRQTVRVRARLARAEGLLRAARRPERRVRQAARRARRVADDAAKRARRLEEEGERRVAAIASERMAALRLVRRMRADHEDEKTEWRANRAGIVGVAGLMLLLALLLIVWRALVTFLVGRRQKGLRGRRYAAWATGAVLILGFVGTGALGEETVEQPAGQQAFWLLWIGLIAFAGLAWQASSAELRVSRWAWSLGFNGTRFFPWPSVVISVAVATVALVLAFSTEAPAEPRFPTQQRVLAEQAEENPRGRLPSAVQAQVDEAETAQRRAANLERKADTAQARLSRIEERLSSVEKLVKRTRADLDEWERAAAQ